MKFLLTLTSVIEAATGVALIAVPAVIVELLLGAEISGASIPLGRVAGVALLSLGLACWPGRDRTGNAAAPLRGMLTYNVLATLYFLGLGMGGEFVGRFLWPAVLVHGILSLLLARQMRANRGGSPQ